MLMNKQESLFFPSSVYETAVIRRAVEDYKPICRVDLSESTSGVTCRFKTTGQIDASLVAREFSNYLIELSNASGVL